MKIDFAKLWPGGNDTVIVQSDVPANKRAEVAQLLMSNRYVGGEQVGYLRTVSDSDIDARLDMMGGELCVNALRSAATLLASQTGKTTLRLASSGTNEIFECRVSPQEDGYFTSLTLSFSPRIKKLANEVSIVHLDGISHVLQKFEPEDDLDPFTVFHELSKRYADELSTLPAFGVIPFHSRSDDYQIFPVVHVRETETTVAETGCGSGSVALALSLIEDTGSCGIFQPSDSRYQIEVSRTGEQTNVTLGSDVQILVQGTAFIPELAV